MAENSCRTHAVAAYAKRSMLCLLLGTSFQGDPRVTGSKSEITRTFWEEVNLRWTVHRSPFTHSGSLAGISNRTSWMTMSVTTARPALSIRNPRTFHECWQNFPASLGGLSWTVCGGSPPGPMTAFNHPDSPWTPQRIHPAVV